MSPWPSDAARGRFSRSAAGKPRGRLGRVLASRTIRFRLTIIFNGGLMSRARAVLSVGPRARSRARNAGRSHRLLGRARLRPMGRKASTNRGGVGVRGARGLSGKIFPWGDEFKPGGQWMTNSHQGQFPHHDTGADHFTGVAPVGQFPRERVGLHDVAGNVRKWVNDWYRPDYYAELAATEPSLEPQRTDRPAGSQ